MKKTSKTAVKTGNSIFILGGIAVILMLALIPIQAYLYIKFPPPAAAADYFNLFAKNKLLALVSLDLLFAVSNLLIFFVYLPLYFFIRDTDEKLSKLAMLLAFIGVAAYLSTNPAFGMMNLYTAYAKTDIYAMQSNYLGAGEALLSNMTGTAYLAYYVMNALAILLISVVMLKSKKFGIVAPIAGIIAGFFMTVPASAGKIGLLFSFISIIPYVLWMVMLAKYFLWKKQ